MDFKTFNSVVFHIINARHPVMIRGRHGIGKSELVAAISRALGKPLVMRRASQMTEGDLLGLPSIEGNSTVWNPPDWFKKACEEAVVLFLDEVDRAQQEVRQGIFELTDSRSIAGHTLHPGTVIFAAVNGGEHGAQYSVFDMDPAELDRYTVFDIEPTVEDWLAWASQENHVHDFVVDFIRDNQMHLEHKGEFDPNKVYPSRRSWKRFSDACAASLFNDALEGKAEAHGAIFNLATGYLGTEAAVGFQDFLREGVQITIEDLFSGKLMGRRGDKMSIAQHNALLDRVEQSEILKRALTDEELSMLALYLRKLPSELFMRGYSMVGAGGEHTNILRMSVLVVDGYPMTNYVLHATTGVPVDEPMPGTKEPRRPDTTKLPKGVSAPKPAEDGASAVDAVTPAAPAPVAAQPQAPVKRGRGRPRKNPV